MFENIDKQKKVLITLPEFLHVDNVLAAKVLSDVLVRFGKEVWIILNIEEYKKIFANKIEFDSNVILKSDIQSLEFVADVPKSREVSSIDIVEDDKNFKIVLKTDGGKLLEDKIQLRRKKVMFDLGVILGVSKVSDSNIFKKRQGESFDVKKFGTVNYVRTNREIVASSICEVILRKVENSQELNLKRVDVLNLLTGIFWHSDNLSTRTNSQTLDLVLRTTKKYGLEKSEVDEFVSSLQDLSNVVFYGEILKNLVLRQNHMYAVVDAKRLENKLFGLFPGSKLIPVQGEVETKFILVIVENYKDKNLVMIRNFDKGESISNKLNNEKVFGDREFIYFESRKSVSEIKSILDIDSPDTKMNSGNGDPLEQISTEDFKTKDKVSEGDDQTDKKVLNFTPAAEEWM